MAPLSRICKTV